MGREGRKKGGEGRGGEGRGGGGEGEGRGGREDRKVRLARFSNRWAT